MSTTDPDARLYCKDPGMEAKLIYLGHVLMVNRSGLLIDACVTPTEHVPIQVDALRGCTASN